MLCMMFVRRACIPLPVFDSANGESNDDGVTDVFNPCAAGQEGQRHDVHATLFAVDGYACVSFRHRRQ